MQFQPARPACINFTWPMKLLVILLCLFALCSRTLTMAQVNIWVEDFNSYMDGTMAGSNRNTLNPAADWVSGGCIACADSIDDWWEVRSGVMEARDLNELSFLQTEVVDISGYSNVQFFVDVLESGDLEGPYFGTDDCLDQTNEDFVNVSYRIDGGPWILIPNYLNWCGLYASCANHTLFGDDGGVSGDCRNTDVDWESVTVWQTGLQGNTLEIKLETINSSDEEFIIFDNITIQGTLMLPVSLLSFEVLTMESSVQLNWQTSWERQNHFFHVERSKGLTVWEWEVIQTLAGAPDSDELRQYQATDFHPLPGRSFYRLKQVDFDGHFTYSHIIPITRKQLISIYPNPARDYIVVNPGALQISLIRLTNSLGQSLAFPIDPQIPDRALLLRNLSPGIYWVQLIGKGFSISRNITIQR